MTINTTVAYAHVFPSQLKVNQHNKHTQVKCQKCKKQMHTHIRMWLCHKVAGTKNHTHIHTFHTHNTLAGQLIEIDNIIAFLSENSRISEINFVYLNIYFQKRRFETQLNGVFCSVHFPISQMQC